MRISVVIPTFNRADYLPATLNSVMAQTRAADEVIVVDDGSTDDTPAVVAGYVRRYPAVRHVRRENGGLGVARNTGYAEAKGDALLFLDSDDLLLPAALERLEEALQRCSAAPLAFCRAQIIDSVGAVTKPLWEVDDTPEGIWRNLLGSNKLRSPGAVLIHRAAMEKVGPWDPALRGSEDWDLWLRLAEDGSPFVRVDEPLFQYRVHGDNMSGDASLMHAIRLKVYRKHLDRHEADPGRYAAVWRHYVATLPPAAVGPAAEEACRVLGEGSRAEVWAHARRAAAHSRRHLLLRGLIEGSGVATLYRRTPLGLRLRMRSLFGVRADAN